MKRKSTLSILRETCRGVCVKRLTHRLGAWQKRRYKMAFTLIEVLIVIAVIVVLTGLILTTIGYVQKKRPGPALKLKSLQSRPHVKATRRIMEFIHGEMQISAIRLHTTQITLTRGKI